VAEVHPGFQQILHRNTGQATSLPLTFAELEPLARSSKSVLLAFLDA
jgi:hypothetical protein